MALMLQWQKDTKLLKRTNVCYIFFFPVVCIHFYSRKVETTAEYILCSKAPWRHFYKPIPLLFIALRSKWKDEIPQWMRNKRQKHNLIYPQQAGKSPLVLELTSFWIKGSDCLVRWFGVRRSLRSHSASGWSKDKTIWGMLYTSSRLCSGRIGSVVWGNRWVFGNYIKKRNI